MSEGYSGTPLAKKLSLKDGMRLWRSGMPESVSAEIGPAPLTMLDAPEHRSTALTSSSAIGQR